MKSVNFVLYSNTSRNGTQGLKPRVMWNFESETILAALDECNQSGTSLEEFYSIDFIEDDEGNVKPSRELTYDELLEASVYKLGDDGRMYMVFHTDELGTEAFLCAAEKYNLKEEAKEIVNRFNSI